MNHPTRRKLVSIAITTAALSLGMLLPSLAAKPLSATTPEQRQLTTNSAQNLRQQTDARQLTEPLLAAEMAQWSPSDKAAVKALLAMNLGADDLTILANDLAALDEATLKATIKGDETLGKISKIAGNSDANLKGLPVLLLRTALATHMANIAQAFVMGNVRGAIASANLDVPALISVLLTGDHNEFSTLLSAAFPRQETFVNALSTGADFACNSATYDFNRRNCSRFSGFVRNLLNSRAD
ncbi:MAG: hypothetical protein HC800_20115 [Phormidesmis sp. RL_2_1]|nr:hypothetical protein [Phormidesmis sp. RL_2_1]